MSFGAEVKSEICSHHLSKRCCRRAQTHGMVLGIRQKKNNCITFKCSNNDVALLAAHSFEKLFGECRLNKLNNGMFNVESVNAVDLTEHKEYLIDKECCLSAYVSGAFLACGQLTNPGQTYRLDFNLANQEDASRLVKLLQEAGFSPRMSVKSSGKATIYFKNSGDVEDLMTYMGAPLSTLDLMEIRVEKDYKNHLNRTINFETANYFRSYSLCEQQITVIDYLRSVGVFDSLPEQIREVALAREANPDASLAELSAIMGISKSGVNRRLKGLLEFYNNIKEKV